MNEAESNASPGGASPDATGPTGPIGPIGPISPPWEDASRPLFERYFETLIAVFARPGAFFDAMRLEGGIKMPLVFAAIGMTVGSMMGNLYSLAWRAVDQGKSVATVLRMMGLEGVQVDEMIKGMQPSWRDLAALILVPVFVVISLFIMTGITHLALMLVGGANKSFEATFRVFAYTLGALSWLDLIPLLGGLILWGGWAPIVLILGLARAHRTGGWQSTAAVLGPATLCLCCCMVVIVLGAMMLVSAIPH